MDWIDATFEDRLEPVGIATGVFLVLLGIGTVAGAPWTTASSSLAVGIKILGSLLTVAVGAGLAWLAWSGRE